MAGGDSEVTAALMGSDPGTGLGGLRRRRWVPITVIVALLVVTVGVGTVSVSYLSYLADDPARRAAPLATQVAAMQVVPETSTPSPFTEKDRLTLQKDLLQYETDNRIKIWTGWAQALGALGLAGIVTAAFTWVNDRAAKGKLDRERIAQQSAEAIDRLSRTMAQLGAEARDGRPNIEARLGAIYALEQIAVDSPRDYWTIMQILTAYVRYNAAWVQPSAPDEIVSGVGTSPRVRDDIQAVLYVLAHRQHYFGHGREKRNEQGPDIDWDAPDPVTENERVLRLQRAYLSSALIRDAHLEQARLRGANLNEAHLERSWLMGAKLRGAQLVGADLEKTDLRKASLAGANLRKANLREAKLRGAQLEGANLDYADLSTAIGLTTDQIRAVASREGTLLPPKIAEELDGGR